MIINAVPNEAAYDMQTQTRTLIKHFWGVKVSPSEPVTVSFQNRPKKSLYICQATLGEYCYEAPAFEKATHGRSLLILKAGDNPGVGVCSLRIRGREMTRIDLDFTGPGDLVISVEGAFDIHLVGYIFDENSPPAIDVVTPQTLGNERESDASTSQLASSTEIQLSPSGGDGTSKLSTESAPIPDLFSHLPLLTIPNLSNLRAVDIADGLSNIRKEESINILLQGLTVAQIEALLRTNSVRKLLDYRVNESDERLKQVSSRGTALVIKYTEESELNKNEVEVEERVEQAATQGTTQFASCNEDSGNEFESLMGQGSPDHYELRSKKSKRRINYEEEEKEEEEEEDQHRSTQYALLEDSEVDTREARKARKKKKREAREELARHTNHESLQNPLVDLKEAKRLKKKLKRQRQAEEYDASPTQHGLQEETALDTRDAGKDRKKKKDAVEEMRSTHHGFPEHPAVDTRDAKRARKKKKNAKEEVRASNDGLHIPTSDTAETDKALVEHASVRSHEPGRVLIVCALPYLG